MPKLEPGARQGQAMGAQGGMNDVFVFVSDHELFHAAFPRLLLTRERQRVAELQSSWGQGTGGKADPLKSSLPAGT